MAFAKEKEIAEIQIEKQDAELAAKRNQQYAIIGGLILVLIFSVFIYNRLKVTRKQKDIIEEAHSQLGEKNQEIMDSIAYAKRIQSAILPPAKLVKEYLKDSFYSIQTKGYSSRLIFTGWNSLVMKFCLLLQIVQVMVCRELWLVWCAIMD